MMWVESVLLIGGQIMEGAELDTWLLSVGALDESLPRMLLAHITVTEDQASVAALSGLTVLAIVSNTTPHTATIDAVRPVLDLQPYEQQVLREWLISQRWSAWARAALSVRAMLGAAEPAIALAEAARQWMLPLGTLSGAAAAERLPTIHAGDRHLVYSTTIGEAQQRGLLQGQRGRPRRGG